MFFYFISNFLILLIFIITKKFNVIAYKKISIGGLFFLIFITINLSIFLNFFGIKLIILLFLIFIIGVLDDLLNLSVIIRFFLITIFLTVYFFYFNTNDLGVSIFAHEINILLVIFLILGFIHTLNMVDGIDGLYLSIISLLCSVFFLFTNDMIYLGLLLNLFLLLGLNLKKYLIVGNSGNYLISSFFAFITLSLNQKAEIVFLQSPIIFDEKLIISIFSISIIDGLRVSCQRLINKKSPFKGDLTHLHHYPKNKLFFLIIFISLQLSILFSYLIFINIHLTFFYSLISYLTIFLIYKYKN